MIFHLFFLVSGKYTLQPTNSRFAKTKKLSETPKFTFTETLKVFFSLYDREPSAIIKNRIRIRSLSAPGAHYPCQQKEVHESSELSIGVEG